MTAIASRSMGSSAPSATTPTSGSLDATGYTLADIGGMVVLAFYLTLKFGPFEQLYFPQGIISTAALPGLAVCVLLITPGHLIRTTSISLPLLALLTWTMMSMAWSDDVSFTVFLIRSEMPALLLTLLVVGSMRLDVATRALVWYVQIIAVWSLFTSIVRAESKFSTAENIEGVLTGWRGTFDHKNGMGIFLVFGLAAVLAFERRKLMRPLTIVLLVSLVISTRSATAGSGMLVLGLAWAWLSAVSVSRNRRDQAIFATLSVMTGGLAVFLTLGLLPSFLDLYGKDLTFSGRTIIWSRTIEAIADRPLLGHGFTINWASALTPAVLDLRRSIGFEAAHAHNGALEVLYEIGIVGMALYAAFFVSVVRSGFRCLTTANTFARWAVASCAALLVMSLSEVLFQGAVLGYLAIIWTLATRAGREAPAPVRRRDR